jgi:hypothetical protein
VQRVVSARLGLQSQAYNCYKCVLQTRSDLGHAAQQKTPALATLDQINGKVRWTLAQN